MIKTDKKKEGFIEWIKTYGPKLNISQLKRKPIFFLRLAYRLLKMRLTNKPEIVGIDFSISPVCNLKCKHCYTTTFGTQDTNRPKPTLSHDQMKKILSRCMKKGMLTYSFQGGEPLMYDRLDDLIRFIKPHKHFVQIITNGTLATEEKMLSLKKAGLDSVCVSIDSMIPEEHDTFRGLPGTFDKAIKCLETCKKIGLATTIMTTVDKHSTKSKGIRKLFNFATKNKIPIQVFIAVPIGRWQNNMDILLEEEEFKFLSDTYHENNLIKRDLYNNLGFNGCPGLKTSIYITPDGDVMPCPFVNVKFGNLLTDTFEEIEKRGHQFPFFTSFDEAPTCLAAENREFMKKYLMPTFEEGQKLPMDYKEIFLKGKENE